MKLGEVQHMSQLTEHRSKTVGCNGNHDDGELLVGDNVRSERKCNSVSLAECLSREKALELSEKSHGMSIGDSFAASQGKDADIVGETYVPLPDVVREMADTRAEKSIEIEQPKMIICIEKDEKEIVKDIGIDERTGSLSGGLSHKEQEDGVVFLMNFSNADEEIKTTKGLQEDTDGLQSSCVNRKPFLVDSKDVSIQHFASCTNDGADTSDTVEEESDDVIVKESGQILLVGPDLEKDSNVVHSTDAECDVHTKRYMARDNIQLLHSSTSGLDQESSISPSELDEESVCVDGPTDASSVDKQNKEALPTGDSEMPSAIIEKEIKGIPGLQQSNQAKMREFTYDDQPTTSRNPFIHYGHMDASVYGPHALSERISYSGQAPYTGSISHRSDSSTTSTRSFAFPILQSEWNSSPVKMAKADRRHYRKYRGWSSRFLCCRF